MSPKTPQKAKAKAKPQSPEPTTKATATPPKPKPSTPKKPKEVVTFKALSKPMGTTLAVEASHSGQTVEATPLKNGAYQHLIKLEASANFSLVETRVITEGPDEGQQIIVIRPAKAFPFVKLPKEMRLRIYGFYFAPKGVTNTAIALDGKRKSTGEIFAKTYADGNKNRVGVLAVNKEIHEETIPLLYAHTIKLESTSTLIDFLGQLDNSVKRHIRSVEIKNWLKTSSRNSMHFLAEARNIQKLRIENGVYNDGDPPKAAKSFYAESYKFLEAVGNAKGNKIAAVDILSFGKGAFKYKDAKKEEKPWAGDLVEEFKTELKAKLK